MSMLTHPLTYADLEREREVRDERIELIEGELFVTPSPTPLHQLIEHRLSVLLDQAIVQGGLGIVMSAPLDVILDEYTVLQPDLVAILRERRETFGEKGIEGAPSLAVEIESPSSTSRDRGDKKDLYARFGVPEYWLVNLKQKTVTILSDLRNGRFEHEVTVRDVAASPTIPGLSIDLSELFASVWGE